MSTIKKNGSTVPVDVQQLVVENDLGGRTPGPLLARLLIGLAITWSLFQLWIASPLPYSTGVFVFNDTESRSIHLGFALLLAYLSYPAFKRSPRNVIPLSSKEPNRTNKKMNPLETPSATPNTPSVVSHW